MQLQAQGFFYSKEVVELVGTGHYDAYSTWDAANDEVLKNDNVNQTILNDAQGGLGVYGGVAAYQGMFETAPLCVTVIGCTVPLGLGIVGTASLIYSTHETAAALAPYVPHQGADVANSFNPDTNTDFSPIANLGKEVGVAALGLVLPKYAFPLMESGETLLMGALSSAPKTTAAMSDELLGLEREVNGGLSSAVEGGPTPELDLVQAARQRQVTMLEENQGFNVSPVSWDGYPTIGRNGTYISDQQAVTSITGPLNAGGETVITSSQATQLEQAMGLQPGSMANGFKVRQVDGITEMLPRSPLDGNEYFLGGGQHLPGGAPEMVIESIPTVDSENVKTITTVIVK